MRILLQDPYDAGGVSLVETLASASKRAVAAFGMFAFATAGGIRFLLEDESFSPFVAHNPFDLVVGLDGITDVGALDALLAASGRAPHFKPYLFLNDHYDSLYHPKWCCFRQRNRGGHLIVGSGNLTVGGLRANCEVFLKATLSESQCDDAETFWNDWKARRKAALLSPDDPRARARASRNRASVKLVRTEGRKSRSDKKRGSAPAETIGRVRRSSGALVAELPKAKDRWNQADVTKTHYEHFFGATPGISRSITLQEVRLDGTVGDVKRRPMLAVKSHNYRVQLNSGQGVSYPRRGRPIVVFVKASERDFRYSLLMPRESGHGLLRDFLRDRVPDEKVGRLPTSVRELRKIWTSPLLDPGGSDVGTSSTV
jgi:hypothetical protein